MAATAIVYLNWAHRYDISTMPVIGQFPEMAHCSNNSDCVMVRTECCSAPTLAINKQFSDWWNQKRSSYCGNITCISGADNLFLLSEDWFGFFPICSNNECKAVNAIYCDENVNCVPTNGISHPQVKICFNNVFIYDFVLKTERAKQEIGSKLLNYSKSCTCINNTCEEITD